MSDSTVTMSDYGSYAAIFHVEPFIVSRGLFFYFTSLKIEEICNQQFDPD